MASVVKGRERGRGHGIESMPREIGRWTGALIFGAFAVYIFLSSFPPMASSITVAELYEATVAGESGSTFWGNLGLAALIGSLLLGLYRGARLIADEYAYVSIGLVTLASLNIILSAMHSQQAFAQKALALIVSVIVYLGLLIVWRTDTRQRQSAFRVIGYGLLVSLLIGWLWHGTGSQRWVGALNPNHFARFAICGLFLITLAERKLKPWLLALSLLLCIIVSSRTMLVGGLAFAATYYGLSPATSRGASRAVTLFIIISTVLVVDYVAREGAILDSIGEHLDLFSEERGIGSGLSGRTESYATFTHQGAEGILLGSGFRSTKYEGLGLHSGVLKNLYDFGVPIGFAIYIFIFCAMSKMLIYARSPQYARLRACGAFILASLLMTFSEPDSFVVGFIGSLVFMLALAAPLFPIQEDLED